MKLRLLTPLRGFHLRTATSKDFGGICAWMLRIVIACYDDLRRRQRRLPRRWSP
jgi:hypothetical protein